MTMKKIEARTLMGAALDWVVSKCEGRLEDEQDPTIPVHGHYWDDEGQEWPRDYEPSSAWAQGGEIIEREGILFKGVYGEENGFYAYFFETGTEGPHATGETHLVAAMRALVISKLGETIEIPEELCDAVA